MFTVTLVNDGLSFSTITHELALKFAHEYAQEGFDVRVTTPDGNSTYVSTTPFWARVPVPF